MTENHEFLYEFGPYTLDGRERVLKRQGEPVALAPKVLDILLVLLENSGHLVEKDRLMSEVWPSTYVEEANLTQNISILRKVLSDSNEEANYIETVPKRGYRFLVSVRKIHETVNQPTAAVSQDFGIQAHRFLAILPFVNASADEKMDYLSDGITENIISSLSRLSQLRIMSSNAVFRYKGKEIDAQQIGRELAVDAVLVGRVQLVDSRLKVNAELVDVANGWQLWGHNYDRAAEAILEVQEEIARQISATLQLKLTGDDERRLTKRYTESAEAYQAYLQARYHWCKFTRPGLEQATVFFLEAIALDPNYALAYAGIVDCYLRLATNYIPPTDTPPNTIVRSEGDDKAVSSEAVAALKPVQTRYRWDWTGVERELKRAAELKASYPAAHQWRAAYLYALKLYRESLPDNHEELGDNVQAGHAFRQQRLEDQVRFATPTPEEEVQVFCTIARDQIEAGNYDGGCQILKRWWKVGEWPRLDGLSFHSAGDLMFTAGSLTGWITSARQMLAGQRYAQALLNAASGVFKSLGLKARDAEAQIEVGYCYYREGLFELARETLIGAIKEVEEDNRELETLALIRLAIVERHAGRLEEALRRLNQASELAELLGPWVTGRHQLEAATTFKNLAAAEAANGYSGNALNCYQRALHEFEAVGNHRYAAVVENNHGYLLLGLGEMDKAEEHLVRARNLFESLGDSIRRAQVDETIARLHIADGNMELAHEAVVRAVESLEAGDGEALLAEALVTRGIVLCRLERFREAKAILDRGKQLAERCGDREGVARALLAVVDEMLEHLDEVEKSELETQVRKLLEASCQNSTRQRLSGCLVLMAKSQA